MLKLFYKIWDSIRLVILSVLVSNNYDISEETTTNIEKPKAETKYGSVDQCTENTFYTDSHSLRDLKLVKSKPDFIVKFSKESQEVLKARLEELWKTKKESYDDFVLTDLIKEVFVDAVKESSIEISKNNKTGVLLVILRLDSMFQSISGYLNLASLLNDQDRL